MSFRRTISLILALVMVLSTIPAPAFDGGCAMGMESNGPCCCGIDRDAPDGDRGCTMPSSTTLACCEQSTSVPSPSSLPATRTADTDIQATLASTEALERPAVVPLRHIDVLPDDIAAGRQRTYLHVSSFLI